MQKLCWITSHQHNIRTHYTLRCKGKVPKKISLKDKNYPFETYLKDNKTVAFLIIKNDTIQYENYWRDYEKSSIVPSFSMAKSITSILIGCAIDDKLIGSVNDPVTKYIPELKEKGFDKVNIAHLLQMTSGLDFKESYANPFGDAATFYYGTNLRKAIGKMKLKAEPGQQFEYVSGNTQLLGLVLERAIKNRKVKKITVEVDNLSQLKKIMGLKFNRILFDNMSPKNLRKGIKLSNKLYETEASGGVTLKNVRKIASTGVERISIGQITHSAPAANFKLEI